MKILLVHSYYQIRGGEDVVFEQEKFFLSQNNQVDTLSFYNKNGWRGALQFLLSVWNIFSASALKKKIKAFKPDVIHIHNLHFGAGPIIIRTAKKLDVPVVITLHNYRLLCPSATLLYNSEIFGDSLKTSFPWSAVYKKVYRNSKLQTFWLAFIIWVHKKAGTWNMVGTYLVLTEFAKQLFAQSSFGVPQNKFTVKPNFVEQPDLIPKMSTNNFLFIGRLSVEKGVNVLIEAFRSLPYTIEIAGDGPLLKEIEIVCSKYSNIVYLGKLDKAGVQQKMHSDTALIFPSVWYEGMPMTIIEAMSLGMPIIASNIGAMSKMIIHGYNGLHFEVANSNQLAEQVTRWANMPSEEQQVFKRNAVTSYNEYYTPQNNITQILKVYNDIT
jgi:glycosyltransferase involved in cell wall biosynthesis